MNREEIGELAAAYALGGLDGADRTRFEVLLRTGDPEALAALRDFEGTLADLAAAAPETPPPAVKGTVASMAPSAPSSRTSETGSGKALPAGPASSPTLRIGRSELSSSRSETSAQPSAAPVLSRTSPSAVVSRTSGPM